MSRPIEPWHKGAVIKLSAAPIEEVMPELARILLDSERVVSTWKAFRDIVAFTDKRVILLNKVGVSGHKKLFLMMPLYMMRNYTVHTPSSTDISGELDLEWTTDFRVRMQFRGPVDYERIVTLLTELGL